MTRPQSLDPHAPTLLPSEPRTADGSADGTHSESERPPHVGAEFSFLSPALSPNELGRLGPYRVIQLLGSGGMGLVFRAEDPQLQRTVALKVMRPDSVGSRTAADRFLREARAAAAVNHDHIVKIYQVAQDRGVPYIALEFLRGESLDARAKREGRLPPEDVRRIGYETALGLEAAHAEGLIHRDIKPANIWLEAPRGRVKILDFGLARAEKDDVHLTGSGAIIGTPAYMSPEQADGQNVDHRTDLFSLGVMLYRLATGAMPFKGDSTLAILSAMATTVPIAPERLVPNLPADLAEAIKRLLARNPGDRFASAAEVADKLSPLTQTVTIVQATPAPGYRREFDFEEPDNSTAVMPKSIEVKPAAPAKSRGFRRLTLLGLALVLGSSIVLGAVLVEVKTAKGTLVIESDDPNVEVVIRKDGAVIKDKSRDREIDLKVGDYTIELADNKDGLRLSTREFTIERNGKAVVRVRLDKPVAEPKSTPKISSPPPVVAKGTPVEFPPVPATSPLDALAPTTIPATERRPWHPKELIAVIGSDRQRHWGGILRIAYSPDGKLIATTGNDYTVRLWDAETLQEKVAIPTYPKYAGESGAWFSPDGSKLAVWRADLQQRTVLYDVRQMPPRKLTEIDAAAFSDPWFPNGKQLLLQKANTTTAQVWSVGGVKSEIDKELVDFNHGMFGRFVLPNDRAMSVHNGGPKPEDNVAILWDIGGVKPQELERFPLDAPEFAVSPDGKWFANGSLKSGKTRVCDIAAGSFSNPVEFELPNPRADDRPRLLTFVPGTSELMFVSMHYQWGIRDLKAGTTRTLTANHPCSPLLAFSPGGKRMAARSQAVSSLLTTFDVTAEGTMTLRNAPDLTANARPTGDSAWAVTTFPTVTRWYLGGKQPTPQAIPGAKCWSGPAAAVLPGGRVISRKSTGGHQSVAVFDPARGDGADPEILPAAGSDLYAVETSLGGRWLALSRNTAGARSPVLIDLKKPTPELYATLADHPANAPGGPYRFEFTRDDGFLLSWSPWNTHLWDLRGPKPRHLDAPEENGPPPLVGTTATLAADRPTVVVGYATGHVRLFAFTGDGMASGPRMQPFDRPIAGAVMLPGERTLMACDDNGRIRFVEVPSGTVLKEWQWPGPVHFRLSPDGRHVFAEAPAGGPLYILRLQEANPPLDEAWAKQVAAMSADDQAKAFNVEMVKRNPRFDPTTTKTSVVKGKLTHLTFSIQDVTDLMPVRALPDLSNLQLIEGMPMPPVFSYSPLRPLRDLGPLKGLPLTGLSIRVASIEDLSPLAGMPLKSLSLMGCRNVRDLTPLKGMPLTYLGLNVSTGITDLAPLAEMPLNYLEISHSRVTSFQPLAKMPLKTFGFRGAPARDLDVLRGIKTLETIEGKPAADFWKEHDAKK